MSTAPATKATHPLLLRYLTQLALHPLRTKAITTGTVTTAFAPTLNIALKP
jgi:peroxisomal membrane protein 2